MSPPGLDGSDNPCLTTESRGSIPLKLWSCRGITFLQIGRFDLFSYDGCKEWSSWITTDVPWSTVLVQRLALRSTSSIQVCMHKMNWSAM